MYKINYNESGSIQVVLFTSAGAAIAAAVHGDVTVQYQKYGSAVWTTKTMSAANWTEDTGGVYYVTFTDVELNTYGLFRFRVVHASGYYTGAVTVSDYATEADTLSSIYSLIAAKVNKGDIIQRERIVDGQVDYLQKLYADMLEDVRGINHQLAGLRRRIGS